MPRDSRQPGDIAKRIKLEGLTMKALRVWDEVLDNGTEQARVAVARDVLARTMPVPKANPAAVAAAAALGAAGGAHLAALLAKAQARLTDSADTPDIPLVDASVEFAPLGRASND